MDRFLAGKVEIEEVLTAKEQAIRDREAAMEQLREAADREAMLRRPHILLDGSVVPVDTKNNAVNAILRTALSDVHFLAERNQMTPAEMTPKSFLPMRNVAGMKLETLYEASINPNNLTDSMKTVWKDMQEQGYVPVAFTKRELQRIGLDANRNEISPAEQFAMQYMTEWDFDTVLGLNNIPC